METEFEDAALRASAASRDEAGEERRDANAMIAGGVGVGALGAVLAALGGAVCPVCVVAAPALVGVGAFKRWRARRRT
jgi:hypothetical protein